MADLPDWTDHTQIKGTDVQVATDIQGAYVMVPIDIQGQYITLDVNITNSQVNVNITNSVVSVKITDVAQVDITAQSVAVKGLADWATDTGNAINPYNIVSSPGIAPGNWGYAEEYYDNFLVPSGKKWLIYGASIRCFKYSDGRTPIAFTYVLEIPGGIPMLTNTLPAGYGDVNWFSRPFLATAGQRVRINILNLDASNNLGAVVILNAIQLNA